MVGSLRELEQRGRASELAEAEHLVGQAEDELTRIKQFLDEHVKQLA